MDILRCVMDPTLTTVNDIVTKDSRGSSFGQTVRVHFLGYLKCVVTGVILSGSRVSKYRRPSVCVVDTESSILLLKNCLMLLPGYVDEGELGVGVVGDIVIHGVSKV